MPYTELPEDFKEKHPSVWVDIDSRLFDPARAHLMYNDFLDQLELAAEVGIVWAERGRGAWLRTATSEHRALASARSDTVWFSGHELHVADMVLNAIVEARWYVWQFSSTVFHVHLATGRIAGIVHFGTSPVHVAAGCLLAAESGAMVTDLEGRPWSVGQSGVLAAATPELHAELRALLERSR